MKLTIVLFAISCAVSCLAMKDVAMQAEWEQFKSQHGKTYENQAEERMRQKLWLDNKAMVEQHNKLYEAGKVTYYLAQNRLSDMTEEERKRLRNFHPSQKPAAENIYVPSGKTVPSSFDWRTKGAVNPIKNQNNCGSCWAFSTITSIETQYFLATKNLKSFAEQQLVDCVEGTSCETGGSMSLGYQYLEKHGLEAEASYPYKGEDGDCKYDASKTAMKGVTSYTDLPAGNEDALKDAVANVGVIAIAINASRNDFQFYA
ncbi:hypothetical protein Ciccas_013671 [Cichlidogyrus casuarinus]|uniref:Cathepsin L n=1 Tax=Cichlidogyrus casuarinus TaxID=1844966 RepID=A0ABD2PK00_9PLAT